MNESKEEQTEEEQTEEEQTEEKTFTGGDGPVKGGHD